MKAKQRQHLKQNELARTVAAVRSYVDTHERAMTAALVGVVLVVAIVMGALMLRQRTHARADDLLAQAMVVLDAPIATPQTDPNQPPAAATLQEGTYLTIEAKLKAAVPKLQGAADAYPDTPAGITARYHLAGVLSRLGRHEEAVAAYDEVARRGGSRNLYGRMARLGKADEQARAGQYDAAIATFSELAERPDADLPVDGILMQLGRTQLLAGRRDEAQKTFTRIVDEHPDSPYAREARQELEALKG